MKKHIGDQSCQSNFDVRSSDLGSFKKIWRNFVALSEYMNFTTVLLAAHVGSNINDITLDFL